MEILTQELNCWWRSKIDPHVWSGCLAHHGNTADSSWIYDYMCRVSASGRHSNCKSVLRPGLSSLCQISDLSGWCLAEVWFGDTWKDLSFDSEQVAQRPTCPAKTCNSAERHSAEVQAPNLSP